MVGVTDGHGGLEGSGRRAWIAGLVAGGVAGIAVALAWTGRSPAVRQPVAFDHGLHVREMEIACATCHRFDAPDPFSGLPQIDTCATCHAEQSGTSAEETKVVLAARAGASIAWNPLSREPPHVFFSHRMHAGAARIQCEKCHPGFADARAPPARVRPIRMPDCIGCHASAGAATRCTACHR